MSDERFTRADWRPGRNRKTQPRIRDWGGRKQAQPELLAWSGSVAGFGSGRHRVCAKEGCPQPAMTGLPVCRRHGGGSWTSRRRPYISRYPGHERPAACEPVT